MVGHISLYKTGSSNEALQPPLSQRAEHKAQQMAATQEFFNQYKAKEGNFLNSIITWHQLPKCQKVQNGEVYQKNHNLCFLGSKNNPVD